jgi:hypothetical protein
MKRILFLVVTMAMVIVLFAPEYAQAQFGTENTSTTSDGKSDGGGSGGYTVTGLPLGLYGTARRPFNLEFGIQLSNGTAKNMITAVADVGINFRGKQFAGIRAMFHPTFWCAFGMSEYITFGQNMDVGQGVPTGDLFQFAFMSKNTFNLEAEFSLTIPLRQDAPFRHKFSLRVVPFGVFHERFSSHNWGIPRQNYDIGIGYTYVFPLGGGGSKK